MLWGCDAKENNESTQSKQSTQARENNKKPLTLAVIPKSTGGEFWQTVEAGARKAANDLGVEIKWEGTLTETEIAEQNKIIENMINLGVDGIALAPLNAKAMSKRVQDAVQANIPVVIFDSAVDGDAYSSFVATDNVQGGKLGAEYVIQQLNDKLGSGKGKIVVLRYVQGTASTEARAQGFLDAVKQAGLEIVADVYPEDGSVAGAKKTAANTLEGLIHDNKLDVDGIFACNLVSALGMAAALNDLRKSGIAVDSIFVGFDSSEKLIKELNDGSINALVVQNPHKMGYLAVETLVKHLRGEKIETRVDTGVEVVTKDKLQQDPAIRKLVGVE